MCSLPSHLYRPPLQTVDSSGYNDKSQQKQKQADGELKLSMTKLPEMQKNGFVSTLNKNCIQTYCLDDLYIATYSLPSHGQRVLITVLPG
jgi:hypothetical protein